MSTLQSKSTIRGNDTEIRKHFILNRYAEKIQQKSHQIKSRLCKYFTLMVCNHYVESKNCKCIKCQINTSRWLHDHFQFYIRNEVTMHFLGKSKMPTGMFPCTGKTLLKKTCNKVNAKTFTDRNTDWLISTTRKPDMKLQSSQKSLYLGY